MWLRYIYILAFSYLTLLPSCNKIEKDTFSYVQNDKIIKITLEQYTDSAYALLLFVNDSLNSKWELPYPVFHVEYGDINYDDFPEIVVGTVKTTRFDPNLSKRLFIFKITPDFYIRPLWLGSRVSQPLVDFRLIKQHSKTNIRTIEKEKNGTFLIAEYRWKGFGLEFVGYINRNITLESAKKHIISN